jgi:hypothetical protein
MINVFCRKNLVTYEGGCTQRIFTNLENFCEEIREENVSDISDNALQFSKLRIIAAVDLQFNDLPPEALQLKWRRFCERKVCPML